MRVLTGQELVSFVNDNKGMPQDEVMVQAGYYYLRKLPGTEESVKSVERCRFFQALSQAMGVQIGVDVPKPAQPRPKGRLKIQKYDTLPVGAPYMRAIGLGEGDFVNVRIAEGKVVIEPWVDQSLDEVPFDGSDEVENCSLPGRKQLEITETCSYTPQQCAVG
jgi:hypothetical protein